MLKKQYDFNLQFFDANKLNIFDKTYWSFRIFVAMLMEMVEFMNWLPWKWWRKTKEPVNEREVKFELIDTFHFLLTLMLIWGMDCDDVFSMYKAKNEENHNRQKRGY